MSSKAFPINSCRSSADKVFAILRFLSDITVPLDLGSDFWLINLARLALIPQIWIQGKANLKRFRYSLLFSQNKSRPGFPGAAC